MKIFLVLCIVSLIVVLSTAKKNKDNDESKSVKKVFKECQKNEDTHVSNSVLKKIKKNKQVDLPDNYGAHSLCILKGVGYINEDNTVNTEKVKKRVSKKVEEGEVEEIVNMCSSAKGTPEETALHIEKCLRSHKIEP